MGVWMLSGNPGTFFSFLALFIFAGILLITPLVVIGLAWRERWSVERKDDEDEKERE